jgi:hypothetical protein
MWFMENFFCAIARKTMLVVARLAKYGLRKRLLTTF